MMTLRKGVLEFLMLLALDMAFAPQTQTNAQTVQAGTFVVQIAYLQPVQSVPEFGTFWLASDCQQSGADAPPYPGYPIAASPAPVYSFGVDGVFLVDDIVLLGHSHT
jgi:hypothetical protein